MRLAQYHVLIGEVFELLLRIDSLCVALGIIWLLWRYWSLMKGGSIEIYNKKYLPLLLAPFALWGWSSLFLSPTQWLWAGVAQVVSAAYVWYVSHAQYHQLDAQSQQSLTGLKLKRWFWWLEQLALMVLVSSMVLGWAVYIGL